MVPEAQFTSYYGRPVVKPVPWGPGIAAYLFLGGRRGRLGRAWRRRAAQRAADAAAATAGWPRWARSAWGRPRWCEDLGRPERFLNMLRVIKLTSPMSLGSWILSAFSGGAAVAAAAEVDRMTGERLPLGPLRSVLRFVEGPAGLEAAAFGPLLAVYTAVLLADTSTPTWNHAHDELPFVFVSSASLASAGLAMITTPAAEAAPARRLAVLGVIGDLVATRVMHRRMDPVVAETLHDGRPGTMLRLSEALAVAGGIGTLLGGRRRGVAAASGLALLAASALTRFGIFEAGIRSAKDPRYTIEPQKRRLAARRAAGVTDDSITTAG